MQNGPPKRLRIGQIAPYVLVQHGQKISRLTASNWIKLGRRSQSTKEQVKLKTASYGKPTSSGGRPSLIYTTSTWVDQFIQETTVWV